MEHGLRQRMTIHRGVGGNGAMADEKENISDRSRRQPLPVFYPHLSIRKFALVSVHLLGILVFFSGFVLRTSLHIGTECEMTYSNRNFLEIETRFQSPSRAADAYKLYKFIDGRDPRYQRLLRQYSSTPILHGDDGHCGGRSSAKNATLVLYIPGHWGSYTQARSVGAHGTQWTRAKENPRNGQLKITNGVWHGKADHLDDFIYDVYAVDFAEQGGALHGRFLEFQSDFVAYAVKLLSETCQVESIMIVAHSMGGYVARLTPIRHPSTRGLLPNIITLATPHGNPLYAFDETIHRLHTSLYSDYGKEGESLAVSISGGLRDEMIEPKACDPIGREASSNSYLATTLMSSGHLGMDHRAIVWCHGVLQQVRKVIWRLSLAPADNLQKRERQIEGILGSAIYSEDIADMSRTFVNDYGWYSAMAIKAAMLYNLPLLYGLYALVASLQLVTGGRAVFNLLCAIGSGCLFSDVSIGVVVILSLVANSIHQLLIHGFTWLSRFIAASQQSQRGGRIIMRPSTMLLVLCPFAALMFLQQLWSLKGLFSCTMFVAGLEAVYLACFALIGSSHHDATMIEEQMSYSDNKVAFAALIVLTIPGIMAGAIDLMIWEQIVEGRSWWLWSWIVLPVLMVCRLKILAKSSLSSRVGWSPAVLRLLVIMWNCPLMLARGNAYRVSHLVIGLVVTELVLEIAIRFLRR